MKFAILFTLFFSIQLAQSSPMDEMKQRQATHEATTGLDCNANKQSDLGLLTTITCQISCQGKELKSYSIDESFLPQSLGLEPGNGSKGEGDIMWGSLSITLRSWSNEKCLEKAQSVCGGESKIEEANFDSLSSGEWKIKRFPGCHEKEITISPFDESVKSKRVEGAMKKVMDFAFPTTKVVEPFLTQIESSTIKLLTDARQLNSKSEKCDKPIKGEICFGDCIDLSKSYTLETLGTPEPLGRDNVEVCGDQLSEFMKAKKLSASVKKTLCEDYFWNSIKDQGMIRSCVALRGEVDCSNI